MGQFAKARWAYECARIALPRDEELLADLRVVQHRLELPDPDASFASEARRMLDRWTLGERTIACLLCMLVAAGCLVFGFRRAGLRWVGAIVLLPGAVVSLDILWLTPGRAQSVIALRELQVTAEPRAGMAAVATVRAGAKLELLGSSGGDYLRVDASGRIGYVAADGIATIE